MRSIQRFARSALHVAGPAALVALALLLGSADRTAFAQGGQAPPGQPPAQEPAHAMGEKFFDDAIQYVARGRGGIPQVNDFFVNLDAKLDLDEVRHEGPMRLWFQAPGLYRQELTLNQATTTKILNEDKGWIVTNQGRVQNLALSAEGRRNIEQLKEDRARLFDLTRFLTLQALKGPGVSFVFEGYKRGSGTYAGDWIKITRTVPGRSNITFWLAYARDQAGNVTATYPGIVRVEGDPANSYPTEDYILKDWESPQAQARTFRYPRVIEAYSLLQNPQGQTQPARFLYAIVDDIKINAGVDVSRFLPPAAPAPGRGR
jgi:hypothetical protein